MSHPSGHKKNMEDLKCILLSKRSQSEKATCYTISTTWHSGKKHNYWDSEKTSFCQGLGEREAWLVGAQRIFRAVKLLYMIPKWWIYVITHLSKPTECATPGVNTNVNYELWCVQCRFISCNKCNTLVGDIDNAEGYACVGAGCTREISELSSQFCSETKTSLKNRLFLKEEKIIYEQAVIETVCKRLMN